LHLAFNKGAADAFPAGRDDNGIASLCTSFRDARLGIHQSSARWCRPSARSADRTSALRVVGVSQERHFTNYYRVLNRDYSSSRALSRILLGLLGHAFVPPAHRWRAASTRRSSGGVGPGSRPKGSIGDRSVTGKEHFVKTSGAQKALCPVSLGHISFDPSEADARRTAVVAEMCSATMKESVGEGRRGSRLPSEPGDAEEYMRISDDPGGRVSGTPGCTAMGQCADRSQRAR